MDNLTRANKKKTERNVKYLANFLVSKQINVKNFSSVVNLPNRLIHL